MGKRVADIRELIGKTLVTVKQDGNNSIVLITKEGETYVMEHEQIGHEIVFVDEVLGDYPDIVGSEIVNTYKFISQAGDAYEGSSWTLTTYEITTARGCVKIIWYGSANDHMFWDGTSKDYFNEVVELKQI